METERINKIADFMKEVEKNLRAELNANGNEVRTDFIPNANTGVEKFEDEELATMMKKFMVSSIQLAVMDEAKATVSFWCAKVCHEEITKRKLDAAAKVIAQHIKNGDYETRNIGLFV